MVAVEPDHAGVRTLRLTGDIGDGLGGGRAVDDEDASDPGSRPGQCVAVTLLYHGDNGGYGHVAVVTQVSGAASVMRRNCSPRGPLVPRPMHRDAVISDEKAQPARPQLSPPWRP
jgi:hypothetical protein